MDLNQIQLTKNFWLREFLRSQTAARLGIDMTPSEDVVIELTRLCNLVLQPIHEELDCQIVISSGYRPKNENTLIGGAPNSAHLYGRAADCNAMGIPTIGFCRMIAARIATLPIDQMIYEFGSWCHLAVAPANTPPRRQVLTAVHQDGRTVYLPGIVEK